MAEKQRPRPPAPANTLRPARRRISLAQITPWLPSGRSLAIGFGLVAFAAGAYLVVRETSLFAVQRIEIEGAPPALAAQIRKALTPLAGESLVAFSRSQADRQLTRFPQIARASYDRDFPHTLRVTVTVEQPVAVLRKATDAWVLSATGRVLAELRPGLYPPLPRIWLAAETDVTVGAPVATGDALPVASALRANRFPVHVLSVRDDGAGQLVLQLTAGREIRLGDLSNLNVKLAVAAAILPRAAGATYVDVSVPTRAVAGYATGASDPTVLSSASTADSQVSGQG